MAKENIYQTLEVFYEKIECCPLKDRHFNFFELVFVLSGTGYHSVNDNKFAFNVGDMFLITPNDKHDFNLDGICEFMTIRFGERYIKEYQWKSIDHIECLLYYASHLPGSLLTNNFDKEMAKSLINNLKLTVNNTSLYSEDLIRNLVNALIVIAARNIATIKPCSISQTTDNRILQILDYIQEYIHFPELLSVSVISEKFGFSPTYLGSYFRKHCNESLQQYISNYRIRLIEHRLCFSDKRVHEIATEFGFTDESHINKFFKRHKGMSLKQYKNSFTNLIV